jgi:hypothetical protein
MTRLVAHADPSTLGDWPWWGWVLAATALCVAGLYLAAGPIVHRAPTQDGDVSSLDALDGIPACHSTGPRGGHYYRLEGSQWVCGSCGDTITRQELGA